MIYPASEVPRCCFTYFCIMKYKSTFEPKYKNLYLWSYKSTMRDHSCQRPTTERPDSPVMVSLIFEVAYKIDAVLLNVFIGQPLLFSS